MNKRKNNNGTKSSSSKRAKIPVEENVIRYYLTPSLEHLSAAKIINLWSQKCIKDEIIKLGKEKLNCRPSERFKENSKFNRLSPEIIKKILDMVLELSEFDAIREILFRLVNPIGQEIFDWIDYQDKYVFYHSESLCNNVAVNYLDCLVWTSRGLIDYEETAKALIIKGGLLEQEIYYLACSYCLEDEVAIIMTKLPRSLIRRFNYLTLCDEEPMVSFWSTHLAKEFSTLDGVHYYNSKHKTNYGINECIFHVLVSKHRKNQVAIKFMWKRLNEDEKLRQIFSVLEYCKTDLKCFFLSQMNEVQQKQVFTSESRNMLLCLLDDWLWKDYFVPTMHYARNIISSYDFLLVVEHIVQSRMEKVYEKVDEYKRYRTILKELWQFAPKHLKEFVFEFENGSRGRDIFFSLLCERNTDIIQLMLSDMNDAQKQIMMFSSRNNFHKCYSLIINNQINVVKLIVEKTLFTESHVDMFKMMLFESYGFNYGYDIALHFERNQRRDKVEEFMQWIFKSDVHKRKFKESLAHSDISDDILDSVVADDEVKNFEKLESFFLWCASGDSQKALQFKREMYEVYFTKVICKFVEKDKYKLLDQFLNWCFSDNEGEVELVKHTSHEHHNYIQLAQLVLKLVERNNQLQSLEKFVCWCFAKKRKVASFKKWILEYVSEDSVGVCLELLRIGMFELAEEFVHWCCDSSEMKINKFKMDLMFCDNVKQFLKKNEHDGNILQKVIKWFNPTAEMIIRFREVFADFHWLKDNNIAVLLLKNRNWEEAEQYIRLVFNSDSDKKDFKEKLAYSTVCVDILESIMTGDIDGFVEIENFFLWCVSGNVEMAVHLKRGMCQQYFSEVICKLIEEDKYELLEQFFKWCYRNERRRVEFIKLYFLGYHKYFEVVQLVLNLAEKNDHMKSLEKFVRWCFTENGDITRFKKFILEPGTGDTNGVCIKLLCKSMFKLADEFVHWCCDSSQEKVRHSKNKLMLYDGIEYLFNLYKYNKKVLYAILEWFKPSTGMRIQFGEIFKDLYWVWKNRPLTNSNDV